MALSAESRTQVAKPNRAIITEGEGKPTIASCVGGIPLQVIHKLASVLVHSVEGCAYQIRYLLTHADFARQLGRNGHAHVQENFLMSANVRRWLLLLHILQESARR